MSLYVVDTDHLSLLRRGHPAVVARVQSVPPRDLAITVITIEEQLRGWFTQVRKARDALELFGAYEGLRQVAETGAHIRVLPFSLGAVHRYLDLRRRLPRLGKLDLAISAIALESQGTLVTRNRRDYEQVPGLAFEDWSAPVG
ncbi:MAG: type II toxin-antitoxin system VapC family toxin [Planctomycetes bacterium]|nr:type II toxin-antitoxin system VapC family toxin [Planctomycetota bacterium]